MFRLVSERLVWWPVTFPGVTEEGDVVENKIELRFRVLDEDEFPAFLKDLMAAAAPEVEVTTTRAASVLAPIVRDWRGVAAENGEPMSFSAENFRLLLLQPGVSGAIGRAFISCRNATPEVREGN